MPTIHRKYGGSTIHRTIECPGWAKLAETVPKVEGRASDAAERGTALHEAMEYVAEGGYRPDEIKVHFSGLRFNGITIDDELAEALISASKALDTLDGQCNLGKVKIEPFVEIMPGLAGGSIDVLGVSADRKTVVVVDYKFGHMPVNVKENRQLLFYALCADADPTTTDFFDEAEKLVLAIIQPEHPDGPLQTWTTGIDRLDSFEEEVAAAVHAAESDGAMFKSGEHCQYCPAHAVCPLKTGEADQAARLPQPHIDTLDKYVPMLDDLEKWIAEVRKLAQKHMENGGTVKGVKLVNKRPTRTWTDPEKVEQKMRNMRGMNKPDIYTTKLNSPAQMESALKKKGLDPDVIADYIASVSSGLTIAPESDKREAALPPNALKRLKDRL